MRKHWGHADHGIRWSEVNWPFDSFLVTLDQPLIDENGTHFDTILLYRFEVAEGWAVGVQLYSSNLEGYRPLTFDDRELSDWTQHSRRVFHITHEIQTLLSLTSFERITWGDIPWPFSSFIVALEDPIMGTINGWNANIDTILVSRYETAEGTGIIFRFLGDNLDRKKTLNWLDRDQLERAFRKGTNRFADLRNGLLRRNEVSVPTSFASVFWQDMLQDEFVMDTLSGPVAHVKEKHDREMQSMGEEDKSEYRPILDAAFRIVVGLCLYLTTLPVKSEHRSEWVASPPSSSTAKKLALSNGAEVCTVSSIHKLSAEEQGITELGKRSFVEMSAHWRRGYWRRKPGEGNDPNALKVGYLRHSNLSFCSPCEQWGLTTGHAAQLQAAGFIVPKKGCYRVYADFKLKLYYHVTSKMSTKTQKRVNPIGHVFMDVLFLFSTSLFYILYSQTNE